MSQLKFRKENKEKNVVRWSNSKLEYQKKKDRKPFTKRQGFIYPRLASASLDT